MKFITVTLNPALDMNLSISGQLDLNGINRSSKAAFSPGGKGVNVSRALCAMGCESDAICILGGFTGARLRSLLMQEGVNPRVIATDFDTRVNIEIVKSDGSQCEINNPPMHPEIENGIRSAITTSEILDKVHCLLTRLLKLYADEGKIVVFSGSIPPDMPKNIYADLITSTKKAGAITVCDCDGEALRYAVSARPHYIKPNMDEISALNERIITREMVPQAAQEISVSTGGETTVIATMGAHGAFLARGNELKFMPAAKAKYVRSLKGAGDTYLAAFLLARYERNMNDREAMEFASRMAARKIEAEGGKYPSLL